MDNSSVIVVGVGEIGQALFRILSRRYRCMPVDLIPIPSGGACSVLHVCYPFQMDDFVGTTLGYMEKYKPDLTIVHSTVRPGTTARIADLSGRKVAYSPVRGKYRAMEYDMLRYRKFVAASDPQTTRKACIHLAGAGFRTDTFRTAEIGELAKLIETTWFGVLIGFAQEAERMAAAYGGSYAELKAFMDEVDSVPHDVGPGIIGGHCVMPNIAILKTCFDSDFLDAVQRSNAQKAVETKSLAERAGAH
jgi:hypothetical protein